MDPLREAAQAVVDAKPMDWTHAPGDNIALPDPVFDALMDALDRLEDALSAPDPPRLAPVLPDPTPVLLRIEQWLALIESDLCRDLVLHPHGIGEEVTDD